MGSCGLDFVDIEGIDGCSTFGGPVYEQIGVVVVANGDGDDVHDPEGLGKRADGEHVTLFAVARTLVRERQGPHRKADGSSRDLCRPAS